MPLSVVIDSPLCACILGPSLSFHKVTMESLLTVSLDTVSLSQGGNWCFVITLKYKHTSPSFIIRGAWANFKYLTQISARADTYPETFHTDYVPSVSHLNVGWLQTVCIEVTYKSGISWDRKLHFLVVSRDKYFVTSQSARTCFDARYQIQTGPAVIATHLTICIRGRIVT